MRIRRAGLGLYSEAHAAAVGLHLKDGIDASIRPVGRGEVFHRQAALSQPSDGIHKHAINYKHRAYNVKTLMISVLLVQPGAASESAPGSQH